MAQQKEKIELLGQFEMGGYVFTYSPTDKPGGAFARYPYRTIPGNYLAHFSKSFLKPYAAKRRVVSSTMKNRTFNYVVKPFLLTIAMMFIVNIRQ